MVDRVQEVLNWSRYNLMNINWSKTKEMIIGPLSKQSIPQLDVSGNIIQRVNVFKLLGVSIDNNLKWDSHINSICSKASSRLHFLKLIKRYLLSNDDLLHFYVCFIRPVLEYACPAWHSSLTVEQSKRIEHIQRRALIIIFGYKLNYSELCVSLNLATLSDRRETLCKLFFSSMLNESNCLHYLLPAPRASDLVSKFRVAYQYAPQAAKTERYKKSFLPFALQHYQQCITN